MTYGFRKKRLRRRRLINIRDRRGLPAKRVPLERGGRQFWLMMYLAKRNGICVVTEAGKPACVFISGENNALVGQVYAAMAVKAARRRNPQGVFTYADEILGAVGTDRWMTSENFSLDGRRPVEYLTTDAGVKLVLKILYRIGDGTFA